MQILKKKLSFYRSQECLLSYSVNNQLMPHVFVLIQQKLFPNNYPNLQLSGSLFLLVEGGRDILLIFHISSMTVLFLLHKFVLKGDTIVYLLKSGGPFILPSLIVCHSLVALNVLFLSASSFLSHLQ